MVGLGLGLGAGLGASGMQSKGIRCQLLVPDTRPKRLTLMLVFDRNQKHENSYCSRDLCTLGDSEF